MARPPRIPLPADEVHAWLIDLSARAPEPDAALLSAAERARAARFIDPVHARRYAVAHHSLRSILAAYLDLDPASIEFRESPQGKPGLPRQRVRFNLSHSAEAALIGVALDREIGIDIEQERSSPDLAAVARRFFAPAEVAALEARPESERLEVFFRIWTRKEAYIKGLGGGLAIPLDSFEVSLDRGSARLLRTSRAGAWSMMPVPAPPGYAAAVAVEGGPFTLRQMSLAELAL